MMLNIIAIALVFFAFSSIVANYYYGETGLRFFTKSKIALLALRIGVLLMVVWGSVQAVETVWNLADMSLGLMALVNLVAVLGLGAVAVKVIRDYDRQRAAGVKDPEFDVTRYPELADKTAPGVWGKEDTDEQATESSPSSG